jgi:hypothetical protein
MKSQSSVEKHDDSEDSKSKDNEKGEVLTQQQAETNLEEVSKAQWQKLQETFGKELELNRKQETQSNSESKVIKETDQPMYLPGLIFN